MISAENETFRQYAWIEGVSLIISAIVILWVNTLLKYFHEKVKFLIKKYGKDSQKAIVIRKGRKETILAKEILAGDLILLNEGMELSTEGILVKGFDVIVDESKISGKLDQVYKEEFRKCLEATETIVPKYPSCLLLSSSSIISGEGLMISLCTPDNSQSKKASLVKENPNLSSLHHQITVRP